MKKFFRGFGKKSQPKGSSPGPSPSLSRRGGATATVIGYDVKEKELGKLHKAAWTGDVAKVKQLAKKDPSPFDKENRTPLHLACVTGHVEVVKELLEWKAKTKVLDNEGKTPLMKAVECQREECVRLLVHDVDLDVQDIRGDTALHLAVAEGNITLTDLLIKDGADISKTNKAGCTPLHLAVCGKIEQIVDILLKEKAYVDCTDGSGRTPLMLACQDGNLSMVNKLLERNADTELKDIKGWTADDIAVMQGHHNCSHLITSRNYQLKRPPSASSTPRSGASVFGDSAQNTPRQESASLAFGAPVGDMVDEDSGDETVSKASGGVGGYDSWNSDTDLSLATDDKKRTGPKLNLSKIVKNMSESDELDTPRGGVIPEEVEADDGRSKDKVEAQDSLQSQHSLPDQWSDRESPPAQKRSATRVSFKRDEELSQVHNISAQDESSDMEPQHRILNNGQPEVIGGYTSSASLSPSKQTPEMSQEKMRALMDELGISDADDISDVEFSEDVSIAEGNPLQQDTDDNAPRPGILKNWKQPINLAATFENDAGDRGHEQREDSVSGEMSEQQNQADYSDDTYEKFLMDSVDDDDGENYHFHTGQTDDLYRHHENDHYADEYEHYSRQHDNNDGYGTRGHGRSSHEQDSYADDQYDHYAEGGDKSFQGYDDSYNENSRSEVHSFEENDRSREDERFHDRGVNGSGLKRGRTFESLDQQDHQNRYHNDLNDTGHSDIQQLGYTDETEIDDYVIPVKLKKAKSLEDLHVDDDSHENGQDEHSEWDSDVEGLLSPRQTHMAMAKQEAIVEENEGRRVAEKVDMASSGQAGLETSDQALDSLTQESDWDSTVDAVTPRNQNTSGYQQFQNDDALDQGVTQNVSVTLENNDLNLETVTPVQSTPVKVKPSPMTPLPGEEEDESAWDSEDELSNRDVRQVPGRPTLTSQNNVREEFESDEEEESISEWELERQKEKERQQLEEENRDRERQQREAENQRRLQEEAERQRQMQEEAERQTQMEEEAERQRLEESERHRQMQEEAERQRQLQEAERRRQIEEAERQRQIEEAERQRQIEEAERQRQMQEAEQHRQLEEADRQRRMQEEAERQNIWEEEQRQREEAVALEAELELQREKERQSQQAPAEHVFSAGNVSNSADSNRDYADLDREELNNIHRGAVTDTLVGNPSGREYSPTDNDGLIRMSLQSDGNSYDEEDSMMSDNFLDSPRDARNQSGILSAGNLYANLGIPPDDDGLSYTSTEDFGGELQRVPFERDILSGMTFGDSSTAIKLQENIREQKRLVEREKSQRMLMENKHRILLKENDDLQRKVEDLSQQRSSLEQVKLDLEAKQRSLAYNLNEETEKRKNADVLLLKIKEQLERKEEQYTSEMEAKQKAELSMRNVQMELRSAQSAIKQLTDEKQDLERHLAQEKSARALQEQFNDEQQRRHRQLQHDTSRTASQTSDALNKLEASDEGRKHAQDTVEKLRAEVYALKMELDRQRARFKDDHTVLSNENEELQARIEDLKNDLKLNEEALAHATMQYNVQLSSMRTENSMLTSSLEKERASKDKVETELESMRNRQHTASLELERSQQARSEAERMHQREKDDFSKQMDRREQELSNTKDSLQSMHQRATTAEAKLSSVENELHASNSSLLEKNTTSAQLQREVEHLKSQMENLDENFRKEKEQATKFQVKLEAAQDRVNTLQHENLTLKQHLETTQHSLNDRTGIDINDKFNAMLSSIKSDHDKSRSALEEKNSSMSESVNRLREELRNSDNKRMNLEQELRHLNQDHNDAVKRLTSTEASLEVTQKLKIQLEQERNQLRMDAEKSAQKYEIAHDKTVELQARITELVDRLERAEHTSMLSTQQLAHSSVNMQAFSKTRNDMEDSVHKLEVEKARLETELKHEKQRVELLQRDLEDSQKVRSSLEALCSNLKTTNAHLEDKLGEVEDLSLDQVEDEETVTRTVLHQEAEDTKDMWEREVLSRSKLGLRIAQLDRQKQDVLAQVEEEKRKVRKALEAKRIVEAKLETEIDKNSQLQKEIAHLRAYLKSAKKKLRLNNIDDLSELQNLLQGELDQKDQLQSKNRTLESLLMSSKAAKLDKNRHMMEDDYLPQRFQMENGFTDNFELDQVKRELEAKYRMELNRKLEDVNRYLEEQAQARDRLDHVRNNNESSLKTEKRKLEDEVSELRLKYEQAVAERQSKDLEARRFRDLYDGEMKWRMKLGDQLQRSTEKSYGYKSRLATEMQRSRIYGSLGNLSSPLSIVDNSPLDAAKVPNSDYPLNRHLKAELDRSIAKHLEAGPHDNLKPVVRTTEENPLLNSSLAKSNADYLAILKKKYFV